MVAIVTLIALGLSFSIGCEPKGMPATTPPPPMNNIDDSRSSSDTQYSYKHKSLITSADRRKMQEIYVVAVARVGDTNLVEDSPFGNKINRGTAAGVNVKVKAEANKKSDITVKIKQDQKLQPKPVPKGFTTAARHQIISNLQKKRCFTVVERNNINDIIREIQFGQSQWVNKDSAAAKGNLQGVHYIIKGGLEVNAQAFTPDPVAPDNWVGYVGFPESGYNDLPYIFRLRMYHVETGTVVAVGDGYGKTSNESILRAVDALTTLCLRDYRENYK